MADLVARRRAGARDEELISLLRQPDRGCLTLEQATQLVSELTGLTLIVRPTVAEAVMAPLDSERSPMGGVDKIRAHVVLAVQASRAHVAGRLRLAPIPPRAPSRSGKRCS